MMSMNDAAVNAKEDAAKALVKLITSPENLANLSLLRQEYAQRQQQTDAQLSSTVLAQVEQAKSGIEEINTANDKVLQLQGNFDEIDGLCKQCAELIENHELIKALNMVRKNLHKTIKDAEGMLSIQEEASEARASLSDPRELVKTYERLAALEGKRRIALAAAASRPQEAGKLTEYFEDVNRTKEKFEQTLWGHIRDFSSLAKKSPQTLVRALRVVAMQEMMEEQAEEERESGETGDEDVLMQKEARGVSFQDLCYRQIQLGVEDRFDNLLNRLVYQDLKAVLEEATLIADDLPDVHKYVAPCFPPDYDIFQLVVQLYTQQFVTMLQRLSDRATDITNIEILKLVAWLNTCEAKMLQLGVEPSVAMLPAESGALDPLIDEYVARMRSTMQQWLTNLYNMAKEKTWTDAELQCPLFTPIPVDMFRLMAEQVEMVKANSNSLMLFKVGQATIQVMTDFQRMEQEQISNLGATMPLEHICAMVNDNVRCHEETMELENLIIDSLEPKHQDEIEFQEPCSGFIQVTKDAAILSVEHIFAYEDMAGLLRKLFSKEWEEGGEEGITAQIVATLDDFLGDIRKWVLELPLKKILDFCMERVVVTYIAQLLSIKGAATEESLVQLERDETELRDFFKELRDGDKVDRKLQPLSDIRALIASDSVETFELCYTQLLHTCPDCPPEALELLVNLRADIPLKERKEVVLECKEVWHKHLTTNGAPNPDGIFAKAAALRAKRA